MYGDAMHQLPPVHNQHLVVAGGDLHRGPPMQPPPMMRQPSASSSNINPDYHHSLAPNHFDCK
ncbi:unnamed protein product [Thlaspi arvense]|uniref:Uncharacterized protein n=1 Tax=Thlaspi arvense TaxID=13288 RepID=A0AAU9SUS4_THLAR|nr:unnamed protein product [Thlaspi arvense]